MDGHTLSFNVAKAAADDHLDHREFSRRSLVVTESPIHLSLAGSATGTFAVSGDPVSATLKGACDVSDHVGPHVDTYHSSPVHHNRIPHSLVGMVSQAGLGLLERGPDPVTSGQQMLAGGVVAGWRPRRRREGFPEEMPKAGDELLPIAAGRTMLSLAGHVVRPAWGGSTLPTGAPACPQEALVPNAGSLVDGKHEPGLGAWHAEDGEVLVAERAVQRGDVWEGPLSWCDAGVDGPFDRTAVRGRAGQCWSGRSDTSAQLF
jgi:hypothetical protein